MGKEQFKEHLMKFDLTRQEAAVYESLLENGKLTGYEAAKLTGIYTCSFTDAKSIPAADLGYAAIAQGLKMVNGDEQKRFLPNAIATREQAAIMLYNFMNR